MSIGKTNKFNKVIQLGRANFRPLEWILVEEKDNKALLICKESVGSKPLHSSEVQSSGELFGWGECELREWLNGSFIDSTFSKNEQSILLETPVSTNKTFYNGRRSGYSVEDTTTDKVFLLGGTEDIFPELAAHLNWRSPEASNEERWWLRTINTEKDAGLEAYCLVQDDSFDEAYNIYTSTNLKEYYKIRPMIWIDYQAYAKMEEEIATLMNALIEKHWEYNPAEKQKLLQKKERLEADKAKFVEQNGNLATYNVDSLIEKLEERKEALGRISSNPDSTQKISKELLNYYRKAADYIKQLEPIAIENRDLYREYEKICLEIDSVNKEFERIKKYARAEARKQWRK